MRCSVCRDLMPADCPGCADNDNQPVETGNLDNPGNLMEELVHQEMFRDCGEPREAPGEYFPGCYEG